MELELKYNNIINTACKPLFQYYPIINFRYIEVYENGSFFAFSSNDEFYQEYINRGYLQKTPIFLLARYGAPGIYLDDFNSCPDKNIEAEYKKLLLDFSYGHSFSFVKQEQNSLGVAYKVYLFDANEKDTGVNNLYINNVDVLKQFIRHIDQTISHFKNEIELNTVAPDHLDMFNTLFQKANLSLAEQLETKTKILSSLDVKGLYDKTPTTREMEILLWHLKGKSAAETSSILHISPRTVEKHFERLRKKLNCFSKSQIAVKVARFLDF